MKLNWSDLRGVGNLKIMKVTIIGPFLPYVFKLVDALAQADGFVSFLGPLVTNWPHPKLVSLHFFYFGATFLGLGSAVYLIYCPKIVKLYADYVAYIRHEATIRSTAAGVQENQIQAQLKTQYEQEDISHPSMRQSIFALYVLGFVLLFLPPVYRFFEVVKTVIC